MKMILFVAALAFAGCSKKTSTSQCNASIGKAVDNMMASGKARMKAMRAQMTPEQQAQMDAQAGKLDEIATKMKDVMAKDCVDQKWSADVLKCLDSVSTRPDMQKCRGMLPPDQGAKVQSDIMQVMMSSMGGMGGMHGGMPHAMPAAPAGGAAPEAGGSAGAAMGGAGSAAAGSAAAAPAGSGK